MSKQSTPDMPWPEEWPRRSSRAVVGAVSGLPLGALTIGGGIAMLGEGNRVMPVFLFACGWLLVCCTTLLPSLLPGGPGRSRDNLRLYSGVRADHGTDVGPGVLLPVSRPVLWSLRALIWPYAVALPLSLVLLVMWRAVLSPFGMLLWIAAVAYGSWRLVRAWQRASRCVYPQGLLLTPEGIAFRRPTRERFVSWQQLLGFGESFEDQGSNWLVVPLEHGDQDPEQTPVPLAERQIVANRLGVDPALVPAVLRFYLDNPGFRAELTGQDGVQRIRTANFTLDSAAQQESERLRMQELAPFLPAGQDIDTSDADDASPVPNTAQHAPGTEVASSAGPETPEQSLHRLGTSQNEGSESGRPPAWRTVSPPAYWGLWAAQLVALVVGAVVGLGYGMPGVLIDLLSGMPVAVPASAVVFVPAGTLGLVLMRTERIRCAEVTRDADGVTIRPARRLRPIAWLSIGVILLGFLGPLALLASYASTAGPVAAIAFGWAAGCVFVAWPALSGLRKVLRAVSADDMLQLTGRELVWRSDGYERRVPWSDVLVIMPSVGGHGQQPCIRIGVSGFADDLLVPWRFLTAGPMLVLNSFRERMATTDRPAAR